MKKVFKMFVISLASILVLSPLSLVASTNSLLLVFFNDTHGKILPFKDASGKLVGGISRRATLLKEIRKTNKNVLVFDAGDLLTGSIYSSAFYGELDVVLMNEMNYTAAVVGNHELDFGLTNILYLSRIAKFPFLSVNMKDEKGNPIFPQMITTNIDGLRVAIVGLTISDKSVYSPIYLSGITIESELVSITNFIVSQKVREKNDLVILLSHTYLSTNYRIAETGLVDVILSGHDHALTSRRIGNTLVAQAWQWGGYAGIVRVDFVGKNIVSITNYFILIDDTFTNDEKIDSIIKQYDVKLSDKFNSVIAKSEIFLDASKIRSEYSPLGGIVADIVARQSQVEIAIINAGSIRSSIQKGNITIKDIYELYPFDNNVVVLNLRGRTLKKIMEKGLNNRGKGAFLYYSHPVEIVITSKKTNYLYGGVPIYDDVLYSVAVSDFIYNGGDGYNEFKEEGINAVNTGNPIRDMILYRLSSLGVLDERNFDTRPRIIVETRKR